MVTHIDKDLKSKPFRGPFSIFVSCYNELQNLKVLKKLSDHKIEEEFHMKIYTLLRSKTTKGKTTANTKRIIKDLQVKVVELEDIRDVSDMLESAIEDAKLLNTRNELITSRGYFDRKLGVNIFFYESRMTKKTARKCCHEALFACKAQDPADAEIDGLASFIPEEPMKLADSKDLLIFRCLDQIVLSDLSILNYFLFRRLSTEKKRKLIDLFHKRYTTPVPGGYDKYYFDTYTQTRSNRKTAYSEWLKYYLKNQVSSEFLKLPSMDIAFKAASVWRELTNEEKSKWHTKVAKPYLMRQRIR